MKEWWGILIVLLLHAASLFSQDQKDPVRLYADSRIVNGQSVETSTEGTMKFIISHRFGRLNSGAEQFFGLDESTIRIGLDYGINKWLTVGAGRSSFQKTVDGLLKFRLVRSNSSQKIPFSISGYSNMLVTTGPYSEPDRKNYFSSRLAYAHQLLFAAAISDRFRLQLMPTYVHRNLVRTVSEKNDVFAIGLVPTFRVSKKIVINVEYYYTLPDQLAIGHTNNLALGIDIETKGHVFQLTFSNSTGLTEKFFVTETTGKWQEGQIGIGFNIDRDFVIKGRRYQ